MATRKGGTEKHLFGAYSNWLKGCLELDLLRGCELLRVAAVHDKSLDTDTERQTSSRLLLVSVCVFLRGSRYSTIVEFGLKNHVWYGFRA